MKENTEEMEEQIQREKSILAFIQHLNAMANHLDPECEPRWRIYHVFFSAATGVSKTMR